MGRHGEAERRRKSPAARVAELSAEQAAAAGHAGVAKRKQGGGARAGAAKRTKA